LGGAESVAEVAGLTGIGGEHVARGLPDRAGRQALPQPTAGLAPLRRMTLVDQDHEFAHCRCQARRFSV